MKSVAGVSERLWRVRKNHVWIDAQLHDAADSSSVHLRFFYDGDLIFSSRPQTRAAAQAEAEDRLRELQRAGWNTHW
jgi:hypothetical protein